MSELDSATVFIDSNYYPMVSDAVSNLKLFDSNLSFGVVAALVGYENGKKARDITKGTKGEIRATVFQSKGMDSYVYLLAVADTGSPEILREESGASLYKIFEEYMNGGFSIIYDWLKDGTKDIESVLLSEMNQRVMEALSSIPKDAVPDRPDDIPDL